MVLAAEQPIVFRNDGAGGFPVPSPGLLATSDPATDVLVLDADRDGKNDVVVLTTTQVVVLHNESSH